MEWVSVCLRLVFVPSEAEKVGKFPSAGAKLLPSFSFHNFCGGFCVFFMRGFCVFGGKCGVRSAATLICTSPVGHLRDVTNNFTAAVCEKFWRSSGEPVQVLSSRTRRAAGPCLSRQRDSGSGTGSMLTRKVWSRLIGRSEGLEPSWKPQAPLV